MIRLFGFLVREESLVVEELLNQRDLQNHLDRDYRQHRLRPPDLRTNGQAPCPWALPRWTYLLVQLVHEWCPDD